jgi:uncharacterized protein
MLITVDELRRRVAADMDAVVAELQRATGRFGDDEAHAWKSSLPKLAVFLGSPSLQPLHLYFQERGNLALEYQLPASGSYADAVLLGKGEAGRSAVVIELKDWLTRADRPGKAEGLIERRGAQELHPADQVRGYVEYCRHFHSAVQDAAASVHGCVLFTRDFVTAPYSAAPNDKLVNEYPVFTMADEDLADRVPRYFTERLSAADAEWAERFTQGRYRQQRGFVRQIAQQIIAAKTRPFELLDNQRRAFALCKVVASEILGQWKKGKAQRRVIVVVGPPGSGKSAVAARLWADLSLMDDLPDGNLLFVTTSLSQNTNWADIFRTAAGRGGHGIVRKASAFHPITTGRVGQLRDIHGDGFIGSVATWRENVALVGGMGEGRDGARDMESLVSIVDEAHSLINPERPGGIGNFGFAPTLGPQAYHIIRGSLATFLFLDPEQGFRHRENTSMADIKQWSEELGASVEVVSLAGVQFRCAGSAEYVHWLESFLVGTPSERNRVLATAWYAAMPVEKHQVGGQLAAAEPDPYAYLARNPVPIRRGRVSAPFDFRIFDSPAQLEAAMRAAIGPSDSARLVSSYSRKWKTAGAADPHLLPPSQRDFYFTVPEPWSKVWNVVHGKDDYSFFVQGKPGSAIATDQLSEVGCPYAIRGFDYDYVGVLWLEDLVWRDGRWAVNLEHVHESGVRDLVSRAKREDVGSNNSVLLNKVRQAYRILLTRALKGLFVCIPDVPTRMHMLESLGRH